MKGGSLVFVKILFFDYSLGNPNFECLLNLFKEEYTDEGGGVFKKIY